MLYLYLYLILVVILASSCLSCVEFKHPIILLTICDQFMFILSWFFVVHILSNQLSIIPIWLSNNKAFSLSQARAFYGFQMKIVDLFCYGALQKPWFGSLFLLIQRYSLLLEMYFKDSREKHRVFNATENIHCMAKKAK
jgi:hypothetical protein